MDLHVWTRPIGRRDTVSQSVSSRSPRACPRALPRSPHHRLSKDGFAQLSKRMFESGPSGHTVHTEVLRTLDRGAAHRHFNQRHRRRGMAVISSVAPAARDTAEPGRSSAHHKIMLHVSGDTQITISGGEMLRRLCAVGCVRRQNVRLTGP